MLRKILQFTPLPADIIPVPFLYCPSPHINFLALGGMEAAVTKQPFRVWWSFYAVKTPI
jgi:hypothetical protein